MTTVAEHVDPNADRAPSTQTAERYSRERIAHNQYFSEHTRQSAEKFYRITGASRGAYERFLRSHCPNAHALEYGCGTGSHSTFMAQNGAARVVGIDISDVAIDKARAAAATAGPRQIEHFVMNAERLEFGAGSFDLICGTAILHHLDWIAPTLNWPVSCVQAALRCSWSRSDTIRSSTCIGVGRRTFAPSTSTRS